MEPNDDYDFPCSAWWRGIDIEMPGDRRKPIEHDGPADEHWFAKLFQEEPEKAQERPWKPRIEAPRGGRDL